MYELNQIQKNLISTTQVKKLMEVFNITPKDLCRSKSLSLDDFKESLAGNKKFTLKQRKALFEAIIKAIDEIFEFADKPQRHEDING